MSHELERWRRPDWKAHSQLLLDSYCRSLGRELLGSRTTMAKDAKTLFEAPFVVVSHGTEADPILNYGNRTALELWEMELETLLRTPSRLTAEPVHRAERARLLERTTRDGFVDDYSGIRITATGRRFRIPLAIVWNLIDSKGRFAGQAATFDEWEWLN